MQLSRRARGRATKERQLVFRIDPDLNEVLESTTVEYGQSRAVILCAAMLLFAKQDAAARREILREYLTRGLDARGAGTRVVKRGRGGARPR